MRALRLRLRLLTERFNPPPLALTLALSQGERGQVKLLQNQELLTRICIGLEPYYSLSSRERAGVWAPRSPLKAQLPKPA